MNKKTQQDWDIFYLRLARQYSIGSKDPSTQVGSLIVSADHRLKAAGYNNFDKDSDDDPEKYLDRDTKLKFIKHAEIGALDDFKVEVPNCTIYVYPFMPCIDCTRAILVDNRITRVVTTDYAPPRWKKHFMQARKEFERSGLPLIEYGMAEI